MPKVKNDPVAEAIAKKLHGIEMVPPGLERSRMIKRAATAGAEAARKEVLTRATD